jgi:hypothetical protein
LFTSDNEALEFTDSHDFDEAHVALLLKFGRRMDAADFLISKGQAFEAHEMLVLDFENELAIHRVTKYVLNALWEHFSLALLLPIAKNKRHMAQELLCLATLLNDTMLSSNDRDEVCHEFLPAADSSQLTGTRYPCFRLWRQWTYRDSSSLAASSALNAQIMLLLFYALIMFSRFPLKPLS